jgi:P-type Ca2+ transporter type 2C
LSPYIRSGLTEGEAAERLALDGLNSLPGEKPKNIASVVLGLLNEPMLLLLLAAASIYFALGDAHEAMVLLSFVILIFSITLYQTQKSERTLAALRKLASPRARVIRGGIEKVIPGYEVARDDIVLLREGDRVPADAVLLECNDLMADESLLTGESAPVSKTPWNGMAQIGRPGGDSQPFVYSGSMLTQGQGIAKVVATGAQSEIGKIGRALQTLSDEPSPLQKETSRIVTRLAFAALLICVTVAVLYGLSRGNWLAAILASITLAMAIIPNEYPAVLAVFLALGAWRISKQGVLTRRIPAIEMLGAATVLCVDKTGTLTQNRMSICQLYTANAIHKVSMDNDDVLPEQFHSLVEFGILASETNPFDPMEKAFHDLGRRYLARTEHLHSDWKLVREYPLTRKLLAHSHGWLGDGNKYAIATKGAPEAIADLCHLPQEQWQEIEQQVERMASNGLRVLGVAHAKLSSPEWPSNPHDTDFEFTGLVGLADPVRPAVATALQECLSAGIRLVMITGDYPATAQAIANEIGLTSPGGIIMGSELEQLSGDELNQRIRLVNIFARVVPEQKLRLVQALRANGEVVAMTGDGVNDAPALKAAHIGIAMGSRGTDVAREAAALVLLNDDFASIVHSIRLGRRIYDNIQNAMSYLLAAHVPIAGMSLLPLLFGLPPMLFPLHVVFMEFIIGPACSIAFEAETAQQDVMQRPPRKPKQRLFNPRVLLLSLLQGTTVLLAAWLIYALSLNYGSVENEARTLAFATLVLSNLCMILTNRSRTKTMLATLAVPNTALWLVLAGSFAALMLASYVPAISVQFFLSPLNALQWLLCLAAAIAGTIWPEFFKEFD